MDITTILDQVVLVSLDISIWSGRKKLQAKDLHLKDSQIPPADLASIGSKKIVDPKTINPFDSARRAAEKACLEIGFKFMKGYCVPMDRAKELSITLSEIKTNFMLEKTKFINNYSDNIDKWIAKHPDWEEAISKAETPIESIESRIGFRVQFTRIGQVDDSLGINDDSQNTIENIPSALINEIAKESQQFWEQSFSGKSVVTQKILRPIRRMRDKLKGLSFIDTRIYPIVNRIDASLSSMPKSGKIMGNDLNALFGIMSFLQDPVRMLKDGQNVIDNNLKNNSLFSSEPEDIEDPQGLEKSDTPIESEAISSSQEFESTIELASDLDLDVIETEETNDESSNVKSEVESVIVDKQNNKQPVSWF